MFCGPGAQYHHKRDTEVPMQQGTEQRSRFESHVGTSGNLRLPGSPVSREGCAYGG